jgi:integrase/recombinase XerD
MANQTVSIFIRFKQDGKQLPAMAAAYAGKSRLKPGVGVKGKDKKEISHCEFDYYLRWYDGTSQRWKKVGPDPIEAVKAQMRQEDVLAGKRPPVEERTAPAGVKLASAIESFLLERSTQTDERGVARWRWELELFQRVSGKTYLHEVSRSDIFAYWKHYQNEGSAPRTCFNRVQSLLTFLRNQGVVGLIKPSEMPKYDEPVVDYYSREELKQFFAACDSEQRIRYQTFLYTGMREREVMFLTWADVDLDGGTVTVQAKPGFTTKNRRSRVIPIPDVLVEAFRTYKVLYPTRPTVFVSSVGKPEGHFLGKLKDIVKNAGLPGRWNLHKFRRTFATMHLEAGTPIQDVQEWIGHADLLTLRRYLATLNVKSKRARTMANNLAETVEV